MVALDTSFVILWYAIPSQVPLSSVTSTTNILKSLYLDKSIIDGLKRLYRQKLKPLEDTYCFDDIVSPLLGNYTNVQSRSDKKTVPGNTVVVQANLPFSGFKTLGTTFLSKFVCSQMPHPLMRVYGALMWSLGKVLKTSELMRVYIGSFNEMPVNDAATGPLGKSTAQQRFIDNLAAEFGKSNTSSYRCSPPSLLSTAAALHRRCPPPPLPSTTAALHHRCFPPPLLSTVAALHHRCPPPSLSSTTVLSTTAALYHHSLHHIFTIRNISLTNLRIAEKLSMIPYDFNY
ncbi:hypothetical protein LR48_Vigan397s000300 [Vigna angularis]|uniref:EH domain-containing protein n=1 Tax=Phaseolus angularis TaxID=3914 RepID=A0A0L9TAE5_PHAAN|nr:hypothetical protein LR48_Vigan397s000300 [Vigna angularis]